MANWSFLLRLNPLRIEIYHKMKFSWNVTFSTPDDLYLDKSMPRQGIESFLELCSRSSAALNHVAVML